MRRPDRQSSRAIALAFGVGPLFAAGILIGYLIGDHLDHKLGTAPWGTILFTAAGAAVGFRELIRLVRLLGEEDERKSKKRPK